MWRIKMLEGISLRSTPIFSVLNRQIIINLIAVTDGVTSNAVVTPDSHRQQELKYQLTTAQTDSMISPPSNHVRYSLRPLLNRVCYSLHWWQRANCSIYFDLHNQSKSAQVTNNHQLRSENRLVACRKREFISCSNVIEFTPM